MSELLKPAAIARFELEGKTPLEYHISSFSSAKTIELTGVLTSVVEQSGAAVLIEAYQGYKIARLTGEPNDFISLLLREIPSIFRKCKPAIYELLGLLLLTNEQIETLENTGQSVQAAAIELGRTVAHSGTITQVVEAVRIGLEKVADKSLIEVVPVIGGFLLSLLKS